jgi:hypothetical protein
MDLIILFFLCRKIGKTAREKGLRALKWQLFTILSWFILEGIGLVVALEWLGYQNIKTTNEMIAAVTKNPGITFFSLFCGYGGYLLVRYILEKKEPIQPL